MHAALAFWVVGLTERTQTFADARAITRIRRYLLSREPWRAAQGPCMHAQVKMFIPPSVTGEELWEEWGSFLRHFSLRGDSA